MVNNFREYSQAQGIFRTIVPENLLEDEHPARVVSKVVESLDLTAIYNFYKAEGKPAYHPKMMLKILFYSYQRGILSSRGMWDALKIRADYIYLSGDQVPDFRTLNEFRKRHISELPGIFAQIVLLCAKLGMIDFKNLAVDGEKIHGNANFRKSMNKERLQARLDSISKGMKEILAKDPNDNFTQEMKANRVKKLQTEEAKLKRFADVLKRANEKGKVDPNINMTDEDAVTMRHKDGRSLPSYNHQSAVDGGLGVTVAVQTTDANDHAKDLIPLVDAATKNAAGAFEVVTGDCAFVDLTTAGTLEARPENFLVPDKLMELDQDGETAKGYFTSAKFVRETNGGVTCPAGRAMEILQTLAFDNYSKTLFRGIGCGTCSLKSKCTQADFRTVRVDSREIFRTRMREKLNSDAGRELYRRRQAIVEPLHGHDQKNRNWRQHHLRSKAKAGLEFMLMRIGANLMKIAQHRAGVVLAMV